MKKIIFFDTETTGLDPKKNEIAQLSWQIYDQEGNLQLENDFYLKCEIGDSFIYHGINQQIIDEFGREQKEVFKEFFDNLESVDLIVCHNYHYDSSMLKATIEKHNLVAFAFKLKQFECKNYYCTMLGTVNFCKLPRKGTKSGLKFPKLKELHYILFREGFEREHNALYDVKATAKCFFNLVQKGEIAL